MITLGVEEEYLLLDPETGLPVAAAEAVRDAAGLHGAVSVAEVQHELLLVQLEIATPVCETLDEIGGHLLRLRHVIGGAAERSGCRIAATGSAPFSSDDHPAVTDTQRYRSMYEDAPQLVDEQLICGMHVHVGVPDRAAGVAVLNRLRPWLPVLVAMSGNSPLWRGRDTGFASWRTVVFGRWAVSGPPPAFADAADYDRRVRALVTGGAIRDSGQIYWQARLSERYPTIEVRAPDVQLRVEEAVMLAGLVRGLVMTALLERRADGSFPDDPTPPPPPELVGAAGWHAARKGLDGMLVGVGGHPVKARDAVEGLLEHVTPALAECGDAAQVGALVRLLLADGNGSHRQRRVFKESGPRGVLKLLATDTVAGSDLIG
ncbi:MAG TPA: glutamate--cysteine ligase [Actinocrinis sp.]|nr:glutamate--cysteine ligase [Actinocrinis sp.]